MRLTILTLLLVTQPLKGGAILTLNHSLATGLPGDSFSFSGTITNLGGQELFLNGITFTLGSSELVFDTTAFFNLVPASLAAGSSYSGELFGVVSNSSILSGDYGGSAGLLGGPDQFTADDIVSADFTIKIAPGVPEPGYGGIGTCILIVLAGLHRKRVRQNSQ